MSCFGEVCRGTSALSVSFLMSEMQWHKQAVVIVLLAVAYRVVIVLTGDFLLWKPFSIRSPTGAKYDVHFSSNCIMAYLYYPGTT